MSSTQYLLIVTANTLTTNWVNSMSLPRLCNFRLQVAIFSCSSCFPYKSPIDARMACGAGAVVSMSDTNAIARFCSSSASAAHWLRDSSIPFTACINSWQRMRVTRFNREADAGANRRAAPAPSHDNRRSRLLRPWNLCWLKLELRVPIRFKYDCRLLKQGCDSAVTRVEGENDAVVGFGVSSSFPRVTGGWY